MDASITVALAAIAMIGTILGLVVTPLFGLLRNNTQAQNKMVVAMEKVARETAKGSREAKQRNGHLGEQNIKLAGLINHGNENTEKILSTLQDSATTLARDEQHKAVAVKTVKVDLAHQGN